MPLHTHVGGDADAQIKSVIELLVRKGFIRRVDRMYKKPKPGKKRLAKWPKKLVPVRDRELQVTVHILPVIHHVSNGKHGLLPCTFAKRCCCCSAVEGTAQPWLRAFRT